MTPKPKRKHSPKGKVDGRDVGWSVAEAFGGAAGIDLIGRDFLNSLPLLAMSVDARTVTWVAVISFVLIFAARILKRKKEGPEGRE